MNLPTLFKRTTTGAIQQWTQELAGDRYRTIAGQMNGKLVASEWTVCAGKNIGRANEASPEEQARREVAANYTKKRKEGYRDRVEDIDQRDKFDPMLAKNYEDYPIDFSSDTVYSQPKLDGIRCIARAGGLWSRQGNPIVAAPHVREALGPFFAEQPHAVLDGELYNHDLHDDFNSIVSLVKKSKPTDANLEESRTLIQYHIYDFPVGDELFSVRNERLQAKLASRFDGSILRCVPTVAVTDAAHLDAIYQDYLSEGYEGQMVRLNRPYENKRSRFLLKRKEFQDAEFRIVEIAEGVGNRSGMAGFAVLHLGDGSERTFKANIKGDRACLRDLLARKDEVVGKEATVAFFKPTPDGIPRFPRIKAVHFTARI